MVVKTGDPYLYAGGNPSTLSDPTGLAACADDDSCGFAGSGTGATSQLTDKQATNLKKNDGAAWVSQYFDEAFRTCMTNWRQCQDFVARPSDYWNLSDANSAALYEAYRISYRHLLAQTRLGIADVPGKFGDAGGRVVNAGNADRTLVVRGMYWDGEGVSAVESQWFEPESSKIDWSSWRTWTSLISVATCVVGNPVACGYAAAGGFALRTTATLYSHGFNTDSAKTILVDGVATAASVALVSAPLSLGSGALVTTSGAVMAPAMSSTGVYIAGSILAVGDAVCAVECTTWLGR